MLFCNFPGTLCSCCLPDGLPPEGFDSDSDYDEIYGGAMKCSDQTGKCSNKTKMFSDENLKCSDNNGYQRLPCNVDNGKSTRKRHLICSSAFIQSSLKDGISFSRDNALSKSLKGGILLSRDLKDHALSKKPREPAEGCNA